MLQEWRNRCGCQGGFVVFGSVVSDRLPARVAWQKRGWRAWSGANCGSHNQKFQGAQVWDAEAEIMVLKL